MKFSLSSGGERSKFEYVEFTALAECRWQSQGRAFILSLGQEVVLCAPDILSSIAGGLLHRGR